MLSFIHVLFGAWIIWILISVLISAFATMIVLSGYFLKGLWWFWGEIKRGAREARARRHTKHENLDSITWRKKL